MNYLKVLWDKTDPKTRLVINTWLVISVAFAVTSAVIANSFRYELDALYYSFWIISINTVLIFFTLKISSKAVSALLLSYILVIISLIVYYSLLGQTFL